MLFKMRRNPLWRWSKIILIFSTIFSLLSYSPKISRAADSPSDLSSIINLIFNNPKKIESIETLFDAFMEIAKSEMPEGTSYSTTSTDTSTDKNVLTNPTPIVAKELPTYCDEAIFDFRQSIRKDFIKYVGVPDGKMGPTQFAKLVADGHLPTNEDPDTYFQSHDRDKDGYLSIGEFVPPPSEIAKKTDVKQITTAYKEGTPYPTGQSPVSSPSGLPLQTTTTTTVTEPATLDKTTFLTPEQVNKRIQDFADSKGYVTEHGPDGRLIVSDPTTGKIIDTIPPEVLPLNLPEAEKVLKDYAAKIGGTTERDNLGNLVVKGKDGDIIPPDKWPTNAQPPYLPPDSPSEPHHKPPSHPPSQEPPPSPPPQEQ